MAPTRPSSLLILKDGHVGSEWLTEVLSRQPGTHFLNEIGVCMGGSLASKAAFFGESRRACACGKEECAQFKGDSFGTAAPCLDAPSRQSCRLLGGSVMSVTDAEASQWEAVLRNNSNVLVVVQTRSNLVKWAWSFFRTGAMKRLRQPSRGGTPAAGPAFKEQIHRREGDESSSASSGHASHAPVHVDPAVLLRMIVAKQARSERLLLTARRLARVTAHKRERVLLYEALQADMASELRHVCHALGVPFDAVAHERVPRGAAPLLKHATEDLSQAIANWDELRAAMRPYPCLHQMLLDTSRKIYDDCGAGNAALAGGDDGGADPSAPCACSWRTPILDANGTRLNDEALRRVVVGAAAAAAPIPIAAAAAGVAEGGADEGAPCAMARADVALVVTWPEVRTGSGLAVLAAAGWLLLRRHRRRPRRG